MEKLPVKDTFKGPGSWFTGDVYGSPIYSGTDPSRMSATLVRFTPGARTHWHRHALGQCLHGTDGTGVVVTRDGTVITITAGDTVWTRNRARGVNTGAVMGLAPTNQPVEVNVFGSNEEMLAKLHAGGTGWDLFVPTNYTISTYAGLGLIDPLDLAKVPNFDAKTQNTRFTNEGTVDGKIYCAPVNIHSPEWLWLSNKVYEDLGLPVPTNWTEFVASAPKVREAGKPADGDKAP